MKKQILRVSPLQSAKVMAALYFVFSIPLALIMILVSMISPQPGTSMLMALMMPLMYVVIGFLFTLLGAWVYNLVAARIGGFEFETAEVGDRTHYV